MVAKIKIRTNTQHRSKAETENPGSSQPAPSLQSPATDYLSQLLALGPVQQGPIPSTTTRMFTPEQEQGSDAAAERQKSRLSKESREPSVKPVSSDSVESHRSFADKCRIPFTLLSDRGGSVRARFGVPKTLGLIDGRVTYVIDRQGVVRHVFNSQIRARKHVEEALRLVRTLRAS